MITVEQKVAAFDALVKLLDHRPRLMNLSFGMFQFTNIAFSFLVR